MTTTQQDFLAKFADLILRTKRAERSNSVRARFFGILHRTISRYRNSIPGSEHALDQLRKTGPFDVDEARFQRAVETAILRIARSRELGAIVETVRELLVETLNERVLERAAQILQQRQARENLVAAAKAVILEEDAFQHRAEIQRALGGGGR